MLEKMVVLHSPVKEMAILLSLVNCIRIAITLFSDLRLEKNLPPQLLARLSLSSLSSLSSLPEDVDVNIDINILPPPPPRAMVIVVVIPVFLPAAGRRRCCILPPPLPHIIVFVPVFLPTGGWHRTSTSRRILPQPPPRAIFIVVVIPVRVPAAFQRCVSTTHPPAVTALAIVVIVLVIPTASATRDNRCRPCRLLMLTPKLHPPAAATASRNNRRLYHRPCLPPRRRTTSTSHPTTATATRDCLHPCLPPHRRSMLRVAHRRWHRILPLPPPWCWQYAFGQYSGL